MFKFSSKIKYGLIGLCDIVLYGRRKSVPLSDIIRRERVPKIYMERILSELVKGGVLKSKKGAKGGFALNKRQKDISLYNIYEIFSQGKEKEDGSQSLKNKKVRMMIEKTKTSANEQIIRVLRSFKLNMIVDFSKKRDNKKRRVREK